MPQGHYQTLTLVVEFRVVCLGTWFGVNNHYPDVIHMSQLLSWYRKNGDLRISSSDSQCYKDKLMETKMNSYEPKEHNFVTISLKYCLYLVSWKF